MDRGISRKDAVAGLIKANAALCRALDEVRALMRERDSWRANTESARSLMSDAMAECNTAQHVLGCVELALAGREPSDDWPAVAHAVAALRAGKGEKREPKGKWDRYGGLKSATHGRLVAEVGLAGWGVCTDDDSIWRARGPETGTAGRLAAEAWLDAQGVEYERAEAK